MYVNRFNLDIAGFAGGRCPFVRVGDGCAAATDGVVAIKVTLPPIPVGGFPVIEGLPVVEEGEGAVNGAGEGTALLGVEDALKLARAIPKVKSLPQLEHVRIVIEPGTAGGIIRAGVSDLESPQVFTMRSLPGQFPNVDNVIPTEEPAFTFRCNAAILEKLLAFAVKFVPGTSGGVRRIHPVKLEFFTDGRPMKVTAQNGQQELTAVLMGIKE